MRFFTVFIFCFFSSLAIAKVHTLKKGETLASVARSYYGEPVFGPKGTLQKIYKLNPWARKNPSVVEPGQQVILEDKVAEKEEASEPATPPPPPPPPATPKLEANEKPILPPMPPPQPMAPEPPPTDVGQQHQPPPPPPPSPATPTIEPAAEHHEKPRGQFAVIPFYSQVKQIATDTASGTSLTLDSSSAYGAELGWDHWWSEDFSTLVSLSQMEMKSDTMNAATSQPILDKVTLYKSELVLFNRLNHRLRFGFGVGFADHMFLEDLTGTPMDPKIYKTSYWNPLVAADVIFFESPRWELALNLKASFLPAQIGTHDLKPGLESFAQLALLQKFETWSLLYGISYMSDDQAVRNSTETRTETTGRIGFLF